MRDLGRVGRYRFRRSSWYDYSWDWALASIFALVLLAGAAFLARMTIFASHPQTAAILDDATTGQGGGRSHSHLPD
jgi:hypothetical protein